MPDRRSHSKERVDDQKRRTEDARDKNGSQDPKERRRESSPATPGSGTNDQPTVSLLKLMMITTPVYARF